MMNGLRMAVDFTMRLKEVTMAALDRTTREVKGLLESVPKVNARQTCFESVVLSVKVGMSGMLCHVESSNDTTRHDDGWCFSSALASGFIDDYFGLNVVYIYIAC